MLEGATATPAPPSSPPVQKFAPALQRASTGSGRSWDSGPNARRPKFSRRPKSPSNLRGTPFPTACRMTRHHKPTPFSTACVLRGSISCEGAPAVPDRSSPPVRRKACAPDLPMPPFAAFNCGKPFFHGWAPSFVGIRNQPGACCPLPAPSTKRHPAATGQGLAGTSPQVPWVAVITAQACRQPFRIG